MSAFGVLRTSREADTKQIGSECAETAAANGFVFRLCISVFRDFVSDAST